MTVFIYKRREKDGSDLMEIVRAININQSVGSHVLTAFFYDGINRPNSPILLFFRSSISDEHKQIEIVEPAAFIAAWRLLQ